jgi:hypothetical protein
MTSGVITTLFTDLTGSPEFGDVAADEMRRKHSASLREVDWHKRGLAEGRLSMCVGIAVP